MTLADARGTLHRRCDDRTKLRIVSLVPSLTELLCALGLGHSIVGRSGWCVHPLDEVERMPTVGGTRSVDVERVRALAPTHLVVNPEENDASSIDTLEAFVPHVIVTEPRKPRENLGLYRLFGHVFAAEREADLLCARFEGAWSALEQARSSGAWPRRRVLYLLGKDPWTTVARDSYVAAMLATVGWEQIDVREARDHGTRRSHRHPVIDLRMAAQSAERVLLPLGIDRFTPDDATVLGDIGPRVQRVDGELLSWHGSRAIAGLAYLGRLASGIAD